MYLFFVFLSVFVFEGPSHLIVAWEHFVFVFCSDPRGVRIYFNITFGVYPLKLEHNTINIQKSS